MLPAVALPFSSCTAELPVARTKMVRVPSPLFVMRRSFSREEVLSVT